MLFHILFHQLALGFSRLMFGIIIATKSSITLHRAFASIYLNNNQQEQQIIMRTEQFKKCEFHDMGFKSNCFLFYKLILIMRYQNLSIMQNKCPYLKKVFKFSIQPGTTFDFHQNSNPRKHIYNCYISIGVHIKHKVILPTL